MPSLCPYVSYYVEMLSGRLSVPTTVALSLSGSGQDLISFLVLWTLLVSS